MKNIIKENCLIKINLSQKLPFEKYFSETINLQTNGTFFEYKGIKNIVYKDYDESTELDQLCTIKISKEFVIFSKIGIETSSMIFEKNKHHKFKHSVPNGYFMLGVFTEKIKDDFKKEKKFKISYTIDSDAELISENKVEIFLKLF